MSIEIHYATRGDIRRLLLHINEFMETKGEEDLFSFSGGYATDYDPIPWLGPH